MTDTKTGVRPEAELRVELACAFRWAAREGLHEATANHFSAALSDDGQEFLINPEGMHFSEIRASDLIRVDARQAKRAPGVDPTALAIHGALHRNHPAVRCAFHCHSPYATALSCLEDPVLPPIDQNTMRFFERIAMDPQFNGMGLGDEAERLSACATIDTPILLLSQHGVVALGNSVAQAFDNLYYFERSCRIWLTVLACGRPYRVAEPAVARRTAQQWQDYPGLEQNHFDALMRILARQEPEFRQ